MIDLQHRARVAKKLVMYDDEAEVFWPVYADYEADLKRLNGSFIELAERYDATSAQLAPEQAWVFLEAFRALETKRGHLLRQHAARLFGRCRQALIANWIQLEDDIAETKRTEISRWSKTADEQARESNTLTAVKARATLMTRLPEAILVAETCEAEA